MSWFTNVNWSPRRCSTFWSEPVSRLSTQMTRCPSRDERIAQMRTEEARASGDDGGRHRVDATQAPGGWPGLHKGFTALAAASVPPRCAGGDHSASLPRFGSRFRWPPTRGSSFPGTPSFTRPVRDGGLEGDATGFYAATREFMAAWGRMPRARPRARRALHACCGRCDRHALAPSARVARLARGGCALCIWARRVRRRALDEAVGRRRLRLAAPLVTADAPLPRPRLRAQQARRVGLRVRALARDRRAHGRRRRAISAAMQPDAAGSVCSRLRSGLRGPCSSA